jgi:CBS domain-containing protein
MAVEMKVADVMSNRVVTCAPNATVAEAAKKMKDEDVGSIVVMEGKKPVGIVTREDVTNKVAAADKQPSKVTVKSVMNSPVITAAPDEALSEVAKRMDKYGYERMPVKQLNKLVGFVSVRDLLRVSPGLLDMMAEHMEKEQSPELTSAAHAGDCEICGVFSEQLRNVNDKWVCDACREEAEEDEGEEYDKD